MGDIYAIQPQKWTPPPYQKKALKFLIEHAAAGLLLDPGLGKTSITYAGIKVLKKRQLVTKTLIIAPLRVCYLVWPAERDKWIDFHGLKIVILHGPHKDRLLREEADIYIINPEGLDWLLGVQKEKYVTRGGETKTRIKVDLRRFKALGFELLVVDELSKFKHTNTNRYKALKLVVGTFAYRWGLTGSPASNGLLDLFGQCYILDQGRTLGPFVTKYRQDYFIPDWNGFGWTLKEGADQLIYKRIAPLMLRMAAEDYITMPELIEHNIYVSLPEDVKRIYNELENDLISRINEDAVVVAANAGVATGKCRQVTNGGIYLEPELEPMLVKAKKKREWANLHYEKIDALEDLVDELQGEPLLVAYDFEHDLDRIRERFGKNVPFIGGGSKMKDTKVVERRWNAGEIPLLFAHPQAAGHGLNLQQRGHHICWHSLTWDFELYDQFNRRVLRQGNPSSRVFVHHLLAKGTIDETMLYVLKAKDKGQQALFTALKELAKVRRRKAA